MSEERSWRQRPPSTFSLKIENYVKLSETIDKYESHPFVAGGFKWTLIMYPKGKIDAGGFGHTSLYVKIDEDDLRDAGGEVFAEVKFFQYNCNSNQYVILKTNNEVVRFHKEKPEYGFARVSILPAYILPVHGFLIEGGPIVVGVDIFVVPIYKQHQILSLNNKIDDPFFSWRLTRFSSMSEQVYQTEDVSIGGRNWALKLYPNGYGVGETNSLSLYLVCRDVERYGKGYEKIYIRAKLRVLDQRQSKHAEKLVEGWSDAPEVGWGHQQFLSLTEIKDQSKGFLVNDVLRVQVEFLEYTKSIYYK